MKNKFMPALVGILITSLLFAFFTTIYAETSSANLVPKMTSNTSPSGIASASSSWSTAHQPWNAFNQSDTDLGWSTADGKRDGWLAYEFAKATKVNKYTIKPRSKNMMIAQEVPKDWTFEGWDGASWVVLDKQQGITVWDGSKTFTFTNEVEYKKYRLNITANNGYQFVTIGDLEMYYVEPEPIPEPEPTPAPETPDSDRAILVVTMITGLEKEFDLSMKEVNAFIAWYEKNEKLNASYAINKHDNNKGPFSSREDYVIFDKILTFEVSKYSSN